MLSVGTSGFSFADWVGPFYPPGTPRRAMFAHYVTRFPLVELDFTYYQMPSAKTMASLEGRSPKNFLFCIKAHREMTHQFPQPAAGLKMLADRFIEAIRPVCDAGKLGCVLAQFPWSFRNTPENRAYVERFRDTFAPWPSVVEFRNSEWVRGDVFEWLRGLKLSFCAVDEPPLKGLMPPVAEATGEIGYIRFHGRNAAKWWKHDDPGERYDYLYSAEELQGWLPKIRQIESATRMTFILFNNCHAGKAARNAAMLAEILGLSPVTGVQGGLFGSDWI